MNIWNSLPDVVDKDRLDKFKTCIDEFWQHQASIINQKYLERETERRYRHTGSPGSVLRFAVVDKTQHRNFL